MQFERFVGGLTVVIFTVGNHGSRNAEALGCSKTNFAWFEISREKFIGKSLLKSSLKIIVFELKNKSRENLKEKFSRT